MNTMITIPLLPRRTLLLLSLAMMLICSIPVHVLASVSSYKVTTTTGSAINMSSATTLATGCSGCGSHSSNYSYGVMSIGFNFIFDGVTYSTMQVYSSGVVSLGSTSLTNSYNNVISAPNVPVLAPFWDQLYLAGGAGTGTPRISTMITGTAPNRVRVVEWYHMERAAYYENLVTFQLRIYETTGFIEFYYGNMREGPGRWGTGSNSASMGLAGGSGNYLSLTPNGGTVTTSSSTPNNGINLASATINTGLLLIFKNVPNVQMGLTPTGHTYNFGSQGTGTLTTFDITVKNVGTEGKLSVKTVSITGDPDFAIVSVPASSDSIAYNDPVGRTIRVSFSPIIDGPRTANLIINSTGLDSGVQTFTLTGIGLAPLISVDTNVLFKNKLTKLGSLLTQRIIISSTNSPTLLLMGFQFVGLDSTEYSIARYPSSMAIPGGKSDSLFVSYKPTKEGRHVATLNILSNAINNPVLPITLYGTGILPHITVTPRPVIFDSTALGEKICQDVTIRNPGTDTLLILKNLMTSNDGDFTYAGLTGTDTIIPPDKSRALTICFTPKQQGSRNARVILQTNIPKTFESIPRDTASFFTIDITGNGVPYGTLSQSLNAIGGEGFSDTALVNTSICRADTITNNGDADLTITAFDLSGTNASEFSVTGVTLPYLLKAHAKVIATVCATPTVRGLRTALLTINASTNEKKISSTATLNVTGVITCAETAPLALFQDVLIYKNSDSEQCVTVTNCGDVATTYTAVISGASAAEYTVTPASSQVVAANGTATFCVKYTPSAAGTAPAVLSISGQNLQTMNVPLSGAAGCPQIVGTITVPDNVNEGGHYTVTVDLKNTGSFTWTGTAPVVTGADASTITNITNPGTLTPNASTQVTMTFTPDQKGHHYQLTISFPGSPDACDTTVSTVVIDKTSDATVSVDEHSVSNGFSLSQNHPNPFAAATSFSFTTPKESMISLSISDITGKLIKTITEGHVSAGEHIVDLDAADLASGTYILTLHSETTTLTRRIVVSK